ncbi:MAG TPA: type II secretion system F family protein [Elusimicrobiales bacterium]|nr:type II secretion system F family protein [Elusimicrobiales bacterium]
MDALTGYFLTGLAIVGSFATFSAVQRFFAPKEEERPAIGDISDLEGKEVSVFAKLEGSKSFWDQVDLFFARSLGMEKKLVESYMLLGRPTNTDPIRMLHVKQIMAVMLPLMMFLAGDSLYALALAPVGFIMPDVFHYSRKIRARQTDILRSFPTFVDLAALMIESGLDYMNAFDRIVKIAPVKTNLELEVESTINEVQLGYSRRNALRRLSVRTGLQEVRSFAGLIIQSDELGTSLVDLLRNYSADMRFRRLNKAEKLAAQASTKMLIPLFIFIFPTVFILMLSPMIYNMLTGGGMPF